MMKTRLCVATAAALVALAACGGGGGDNNAPAAGNEATVPASALGSPQAFIRWLAALAVSDDGEPLSLTDVTPPVSQSDDPIDVN